MGHPLWREDGYVVYNCCWPSPAQSFLSLSPTGLMTIFYCLRFESPSTWRARSTYLYLPGTGCPGFTPRNWVSFSSPLTTSRAEVNLFSSRYIAPTRAAQKTCLPLLHVFSFPEKQRVHRAVPKQRLFYCRLFTQLLPNNGCFSGSAILSFRRHVTIYVSYTYTYYMPWRKKFHHTVRNKKVKMSLCLTN
jgi:hypothetical protein